MTSSTYTEIDTSIGADLIPVLPEAVVAAEGNPMGNDGAGDGNPTGNDGAGDGNPTGNDGMYSRSLPDESSPWRRLDQ